MVAKAEFNFSSNAVLDLFTAIPYPLPKKALSTTFHPRNLTLFRFLATLPILVYHQIPYQHVHF